MSSFAAMVAELYETLTGGHCPSLQVVVIDIKEGVMRGRISGGLGVLGAIGLMLALAVPAGAARATGKESFRGIIAASGETGSRVVVGSLIAAKGVFTGSGRIVEVPNRPSDPDNVSRDDLVFSEGKMHLVSTNKSFAVSVNPKTCAARVRIRQTARVTGGTGKFRHATGRFVGGVRGRGVASRNRDGTCSQKRALLFDADLVSGRGTLTI